ncbi:MAG TPA: hypothetical protein VFN10_02690 [Thermoanaerobaculia bacterium]|nr:hypothetical protein [Thermoanaerobaculia bacterium]
MKRIVGALFIFTVLCGSSAFAQFEVAPPADSPGGADGGGAYSSQLNLKPHDGIVMNYAKVVYIFWGSFDSSSYTSELQAFRSHSSGMMAHMSMLRQYNAYQGSLVDAQPDIFDTSAPPTAVYDYIAQNEVKKYFAGHYDPNVIYTLILPNGSYAVTSTGVSSCGGPASTLGMCAYHNSFRDTATNKDIKYSVIPFPSCAECAYSQQGLASFQAAEVFTVHETREAMTDPVLTRGWFDDDYQEADDKCTGHIDPSNLFRVVTIPDPYDIGYSPRDPGHYFWFQKEWSNQDHGCVQ